MKSLTYLINKEILKESLKLLRGNLLILYIFISLVALIAFIFFDKTLAIFFREHIRGISRDIFKIITIAGEGGWYAAGALIIYFLSKKTLLFKNTHINTKIKTYSLFIFFSVLLSGITTNILKVIFGRYRPNMLPENLYGFSWLDIGYSVNSFPSGHATTAIGAWVAFMLIFPRYKKTCFFIGTLIASSRVLLSEHYLSDILIGGIIGSAFSIVLFDFFKKITIKNENRYKKTY